MIHHDSRSYPEAATVAATAGRKKMEAILADGVASASRVIEQVQTQVVEDHIVKAKALAFTWGDDGYSLVAGPLRKTLHDHAFTQVLGKAEVPGQFANKLAEKGEWGKDLLIRNLDTIYQNSNGRHLVRSVGDQARGFLSDRFRRLDSRPLLDAFIGAAQQAGLVPIQGYGLDTKVRLRAALPKVFEPIPNEVMLFGLEWGNSDFGNGGHQVSLWTMRIWCTNLAIGQEVMRQVHLGKRLDDDIQYSQQTYELDTRANASALRDTVCHAIGPDAVNRYLSVIEQASKDEIAGRDGAVNRLKKYLAKGDADKAADLFASHDVINLPPGDSAYRLSNAVSWLAQAKDIRPEKRLELEGVAGDLLPKLSMRAVEV